MRAKTHIHSTYRSGTQGTRYFTKCSTLMRMDARMICTGERSQPTDDPVLPTLNLTPHPNQHPAHRQLGTAARYLCSSKQYSTVRPQSTHTGSNGPDSRANSTRSRSHRVLHTCTDASIHPWYRKAVRRAQDAHSSRSGSKCARHHNACSTLIVHMDARIICTPEYGCKRTSRRLSTVRP